jgi:hypothetical protein
MFPSQWSGSPRTANRLATPSIVQRFTLHYKAAPLALQHRHGISGLLSSILPSSLGSACSECYFIPATDISHGRPLTMILSIPRGATSLKIGERSAATFLHPPNDATSLAAN